MQIIFFGLVVLVAIIINALTSQGFFNVSDRFLWKQTTNRLSKQQPVKMDITSARISSSVERVGVDKDGKMDAPSTPQVISWYQFGALAGEKGNLVVSGHKDSTFGPGVFFTLDKVKPGDPIVVTSGENKTYTYKASNVLLLNSADLPVKQIFSEQKKDKKIYVITCAGTWDFFNKTYDKRVLVEGELI